MELAVIVTSLVTSKMVGASALYQLGVRMIYGMSASIHVLFL